MLFVTLDIWHFITYAELFAKGLAPELGAALDQSAMFVEASQFVWSMNDYYENAIKARTFGNA